MERGSQPFSSEGENIKSHSKMKPFFPAKSACPRMDIAYFRNTMYTQILIFNGSTDLSSLSPKSNEL